jgi:hypothetical protein
MRVAEFKARNDIRIAPDGDSPRFNWLTTSMLSHRSVELRGKPSMKHAAFRFAPSNVIDHDDYGAMSEALARLYQSAAHRVGDAVANLSASERAKLAVYCYGRAHLNAIGLAIAAQCDLGQLIGASSSTTVGEAFFAQSRDASALVGKPSQGRRAAITLAKSAPAPMASFALDALSA